jgi:hypothetical protein
MVAKEKKLNSRKFRFISAFPDLDGLIFDDHIPGRATGNRSIACEPDEETLQNKMVDQATKKIEKKERVLSSSV